MSSGVSVVIAAQNEETLIAECVASIRQQTLPPAEVLLVDDGSTDRTVEAARDAWPSIRAIRQAAAGPAAAMNHGIREARQPLLAFLDADDLWAPDKLERQLAILEADPLVDGVLGRVESFVCPRAEGHAFVVPEAQPGWSFGALTIRREAFDQVGPMAEEIVLGYQIDWFDRARRGGVRFALPEQTVLHRRLRPGSLSQRRARKDQGYLEMARRALQRRRQAETTGPT